MCRMSFAAVLLAVAQTSTASAQAWAEKMFTETNHNFGSVARGALVEHNFVIKNVYGEDIHVVGVRSSCGCTTPRVLKDTLKPNEQTSVVAHFNTDTHSGQRGAKLTVTFDKPYYAEVQLQVNGYIRTDVVLHPGQVAFGSVDQGQTAEKKIKLNYAGRSDWKVLEAKTNSPFVKAEVKEASRSGGQVSYELTVQLAPGAPAGYINDQVTLVTNDRRNTQVPVAVEGMIVSELTVSPSTLLLGNLQPGQSVTKQVIIRGKKPFAIKGMKCDDESFSFEASNEEKAVHLVPVTLVAPPKAGKITRTITIETTLEASATASLQVIGQVTTPLAGK